jgi:hypothetical protein
LIIAVQLQLLGLHREVIVHLALVAMWAMLAGLSVKGLDYKSQLGGNLL